MSALGTISTGDVSTREKLGFWQESLWQLCGKQRTETKSDASFWGKIEHAAIGDVKIAKLTASRHSIVRKPSYARRDAGDYLKVALQLKGTSTFAQGSRQAVLSPCDWSVYDATRPYCVTVPQDTETLMLLVPRNRILMQRIHVEDLLLRKFSGGAGVGKLALQFIVSAFDEIPVITPEVEWEIASAISSLIRFTMMDAAGVATEVSLGQVWRDRIKSYVLSHLRDPELSIDQIASALNCTKRYVHKVFRSEDFSISEWILRMRLARCREDLRNPSRAHASITDIAYSWGFNNPAHFSKAFKEEFRFSPSFYRMNAMDGAPSLELQTKSPLPQPGLRKLRLSKISSFS